MFIKSTALAAALALASAPAIARAEIPIGTVAPTAIAQADMAVPTPSELDELRGRDASATDLDEFEGGEPVIIIGGSVLAAALVVLLLVLLLRDAGDGDGKTVIIAD